MRINIIGSGITGLSSAYFLTQKGHEVKVFERRPTVGGLASFFKVNDRYLEKYYHHSFAGHMHLIALMKELNIDNHYFFRNAKTGFYYENHIYPFVTAKDLLLFKPLKIKNRIRLGLTSLIMMRIKDWRGLENQTAMNWFYRYSGDEVCKIIWGPLLRMKFGEDYDKISAAWLWNRMVDRKRAGGNKEVLGYVNGGYKTLFDALIKGIQTRAGDIFTNSPVDKIHITNGKCSGVNVNGQYFNADVVLSTIPIPSFLRIAKGLPKEYLTELSSIKYQGSVCVVLKLKRALSDYYWINISDPDSPFVGIIEHTNFVPPETYGDKHFVYLTRYSSSEGEIFKKSDHEIYDQFSNYLKNIFANFIQQDVDAYWVFKDRYSQPVFVTNYSKIMPDFKTPIKNLYILNTAQIYPQSRSLNSSIAMARRFEKEILIKNV